MRAVIPPVYLERRVSPTPPRRPTVPRRIGATLQCWRLRLIDWRCDSWGLATTMRLFLGKYDNPLDIHRRGAIPVTHRPGWHQPGGTGTGISDGGGAALRSITVAILDGLGLPSTVCRGRGTGRLSPFVAYTNTDIDPPGSPLPDRLGASCTRQGAGDLKLQDPDGRRLRR